MPMYRRRSCCPRRTTDILNEHERKKTKGGKTQEPLQNGMGRDSCVMSAMLVFLRNRNDDHDAMVSE